jgi:hypothetical protein
MFDAKLLRLTSNIKLELYFNSGLHFASGLTSLPDFGAEHPDPFPLQSSETVPDDEEWFLQSQLRPRLRSPQSV